MTTIKIDPLTRIEGHLKIEAQVQANPDAKAAEKFRVEKGYCHGEMFRGVEVLLEGRDPMDSHQITQRICGVCPISHGIASCLAQEAAYQVQPTDNGRLLQNLMLAANYLQSHIVHFYHLSAIDFIDIKAILKYQGQAPGLQQLKAWAESELKNNKLNPVAPFLPRFEGDYLQDLDLNIGAIAHYLQALDMRAMAHEMVAVFGGKAPHATALIPTGASTNPAIHRILRYKTRLNKLIAFVNQVYLPDVVAIAKAFRHYFTIGKGPGNYLAYGVFRESNSGERYLKSGVIIDDDLQQFMPHLISEEVAYSYFNDDCGGHPYDGTTSAKAHKGRAYSWVKAPRYNKKVMEVGPLARIMVQYLRQVDPGLNQLLDNTLQSLGLKLGDLNSVMGRHLVRAIESKLVAERAMIWLDQLKPGEPGSRNFDIPKQAKGFGATEAPRGALGHWLKIKDHLIERYQCVVPTTWNCSPRDSNGNPGAVEHALQGCPVANPKQPIEVARIVRSFDPCLACAVH